MHNAQEYGRGKISGIYILEIIYMLIIFGLTFTLGRVNGITFILLFVLAIPFVNHVERYIEICYVLSLIAYFFTGADEAIFSIYTILMFLLVANAFVKKQFNFKNIVPIILLIIISVISFKHSSIKYLNGMTGIIYLLTLTIVIIVTYFPDDNNLLSRLPDISCITLTFFLFILVTIRYSTYGRYTLTADVNPNTFGMACAQLAIVLCDRLMSSTTRIKKRIYIFYVLLACLMILLSGSRSSLVALAFTVALILLIKGWRERKVGKYVFIGLFASMVLIILFTVFLDANTLGIDTSRMSVKAVIESGGTNRVYLWTKVLEYVRENCFWFGYGPGHPTSAQVILPLVHRNYSHTHNTLIEAYGELGIIGLIVFVYVLYSSLQCIVKKSKFNSRYYLLFGMLIGVLANGIGESYFVAAPLWLAVGVCYASDNKRKGKKMND